MWVKGFLGAGSSGQSTHAGVSLGYLGDSEQFAQLEQRERGRVGGNEIKQNL